MHQGSPIRIKDVSPILDHGPWAAYQKIVLLLVVLVMLVDGINSKVLSLSLPSVTHEWGIDRRAFSFVLAAGFIAIALGSLVGGIAGDRVGRRRTLIVSVAGVGAMTLLGSLSQGVWFLGVMHGFASCFQGAILPNVTALLIEYTPLRKRGVVLSISIGALLLGKVVAGMLGAMILPTEGWRYFFVVAGLMPLSLLLVLVFVLPESLRFLVSQPHRGYAAKRLLRRLGHDADPHTSLHSSGEALIAHRASIRAVFGEPYRRDILLLSLGFFSIFFSTYLVSTWFPSFLDVAGFSSKLGSSSISFFGLGGQLGGLFGAWILWRVGSKWPLVAPAIAAIIILLCASMLPIVPGVGIASKILTGLFVVGMCIPGLQVVMYVLATHMYPTSIRATGIGVMTAFGRIGEIASAFAGPYLLESGETAYFCCIAALMAVVAVSVAMLDHHIEGKLA